MPKKEFSLEELGLTEERRLELAQAAFLLGITGSNFDLQNPELYATLGFPIPEVLTRSLSAAVPSAGAPDHSQSAVMQMRHIFPAQAAIEFEQVRIDEVMEIRQSEAKSPEFVASPAIEVKAITTQQAIRDCKGSGVVAAVIAGNAERLGGHLFEPQVVAQEESLYRDSTLLCAAMKLNDRVVYDQGYPVILLTPDEIEERTAGLEALKQEGVRGGALFTELPPNKPLKLFGTTNACLLNTSYTEVEYEHCFVAINSAAPYLFVRLHVWGVTGDAGPNTRDCDYLSFGVLAAMTGESVNPTAVRQVQCYFQHLLTAIRGQVETAKSIGATTFVPVAWGCGNYANPRALVAMAYRKVFDELTRDKEWGTIRNVTFAAFDGENAAFFNRILVKREDPGYFEVLSSQTAEDLSSCLLGERLNLSSELETFWRSFCPMFEKDFHSGTKKEGGEDLIKNLWKIAYQAWTDEEKSGLKLTEALLIGAESTPQCERSSSADAEASAKIAAEITAAGTDVSGRAQGVSVTQGTNSLVVYDGLTSPTSTTKVDAAGAPTPVD